ncbi:MAG: FHA domain-containing protein [Gammaproteobacteria bacterium]|nr:FHA domain-containing protein [Gammaproteobacteria bacterium]
MEDERLPDSAATSGASDMTLVQPVRPAKAVGHQVSPNKGHLKIELGNGICFSINAGNLPWLIGRGQNCDIRVPQSSVSRQHCELYLKNGVLFLKDTSTNGTIVDSKRLKGESVSIEAPTSIIFAGDTSITITPSTVGEVIRDKRFNLNRRENDRRQTERRTNATVVHLERRTDETRRMVHRRGGR